jgi:hypothetical protein
MFKHAFIHVMSTCSNIHSPTSYPWYSYSIINWKGISFNSQLLYALVFCTRYLDLFTHYVSLYNSLMKVYCCMCVVHDDDRAYSFVGFNSRSSLLDLRFMCSTWWSTGSRGVTIGIISEQGNHYYRLLNYIHDVIIFVMCHGISWLFKISGYV